SVSSDQIPFFSSGNQACGTYTFMEALITSLGAIVFRKDLISAMKIPDSHHVNPDSYYLFTDTWKEEWEKGVQVPANPDSVPTPSLRYWHVYNFDLGKELSWVFLFFWFFGVFFSPLGRNLRVCIHF
uniref:Uncharacterized protein n=1 Tax=Mus spicilegus TaxID=10103 RepID=A0A8C6I3W8_MUSSI